MYRHGAFLRGLWAERGNHKWDEATFRQRLAAYQAALQGEERALAQCLGHGLLLPHRLSTVCSALSWDPVTLAGLLLLALTNGKVVIHSNDVGLPPVVVDSVLALLHPLEYPGVVIPFLPDALHPDPGTLINDNVAPFFIGCSAALASRVSPVAEDTAVVDLDAGTVRWPQDGIVEALLGCPSAARLVTSLRQHAVAGGRASASGVRAACLRFVLDVVDLEDGCLANSPDAMDRACALRWRLLVRLSSEARTALAECSAGTLPEADVDGLLQLCRAAYARRLCDVGSGQRAVGRARDLTLVSACLAGTAATEYLSVPPRERTPLAEPQWLHWRRLGMQFPCAVLEHMVALDAVVAGACRRVAAAGVPLGLDDEPAAMPEDARRLGAPFCGLPKPTAQELAAFARSFDTPAVGQPVVVVAGALLVGASQAMAFAGTAVGRVVRASAASPEGRTVLVAVTVFITRTHLCIEAQSPASGGRRDAVPLSRATAVHLLPTEDGVALSLAAGDPIRILGLECPRGVQQAVSEAMSGAASSSGRGALN